MSAIHSRRGRLAATVAALSLGVTPLALSAGGASAAPAPDGARLNATTADRSTAADRGQGKKKHQKPLKMTLLGINDFHGALEKNSPTSSSGRVTTATGDVPAGGGAYLATHLQQLRKDARARGSKHLTVAAGDLIGATPLLSAAFYDEPTIEAMNLMKLDMVAVGNHEFDGGYENLLRLQNGGCVPDGDGANNKNSCPDGSFEGADFDYLAANVKYADTGESVLPPYKIVKYGKKQNKVKIGFIGMTLEGTPDIVTASGIAGLTFHDEVETVREVLPELRRKGVESIVVLVHEGGSPEDRTAYDGCVGVSGPGLEIAQELPHAVDMVVSGHTHQAYNCVVTDPKGDPRVFTSAGHVGRLVTEINFKVNRRTKDVVRPKVNAENHIVTNDDGTAPAAGIMSLIEVYKELIAPISSRVIGQLDGVTEMKRDADADGGDSTLGNLIADAQRFDPSVVNDEGDLPVIALMNPGGIRNDLVAAENGDVTFGNAFAVQPFNNYVVSFDLTGAQILALLNQQWNGPNESSNKILQVSGLTYTWDESLALEPDTDAVVPGSAMVDLDRDGVTETALDPAATYRVVANSFLAEGQDGFVTFREITEKYFGGIDIDAFAAYLEANSPYTPTATDRISSVD